MNKKQSIILAVALVVVSACAVAALNIKPPAPPVPMGKVVYATMDVPEGQTISTDALEEKEVPLDQIEPDATTSAALVAGVVCKYGLKKGQIVRQRDLAYAN